MRWQLMSMVEEGLGDDEIARHLGINASAVRKARQRLAIPARTAVYWSANDTASLLGMHRITIQKLLRAGAIEALLVRGKTGAPRYLISRHAVERFLERPEGWLFWSPEKITDPYLRQYARKVRDDRQWLISKEAAHLLHTRRDTVTSWIRAGLLPARRCFLGREWIISRRDIEAFQHPLDTRRETAVTLIQALTAAGLTYRQIALALGWSGRTKTHVGRIARGETIPTPAVLERLSRVARKVTRQQR
jgi:excisionase family DNA binding protein